MKRSSVQLFILAFMAISIAIARGQNFTLIGKQCPADLSTYRPIDGNELCDPHGRNIKACNDNYEGMAWQACYQRVIDCRDRVVEQNRKIAEYNNWMGPCQAERDKGNTATDVARAVPPSPNSGDPVQLQAKTAREAAQKKGETRLLKKIRQRLIGERESGLLPGLTQP
jgi:hypothetical protein